MGSAENVFKVKGQKSERVEVHFSVRDIPISYGRPSVVRAAEVCRSTVCRRGLWSFATEKIHLSVSTSQQLRDIPHDNTQHVRA